jgi:hypothetical protein
VTFRLRRRGFWLLTASAAGLALAGGVAYATIPDSGGYPYLLQAERCDEAWGSAALCRRLRERRYVQGERY